MAALQDSVADSLLGPPTHVTGTNPETGNASLLTLEEAGVDAEEIPTEDQTEYRPYQDGAIANRSDHGQEPEQAEDGFEYENGDEREPSVEESIQELRDDLHVQKAQELADEQLQNVTPQEVAQTLDQAIEKYQLTSPELNQAIGESFAKAWAVSPENVDSGKLGSMWAKTQLSASEIYKSLGGDATKVPEVPAESGRAVLADLIAAHGSDPRTAALIPDEIAGPFGHLMFALGWNLEASIAAHGPNVQNDPGYALHALQTLYQILGVDPSKADPNVALEIADALLQQRLYMGQQAQTRRAAPQQRTSQPARARRGSFPRMQTNQDLYGDPEVLARLANERV